MMHNSALGHGLAIGDIPEEVVLPDTMTAAVIDAPGDCSVLHLATVPTPTAINAEFAVKVIAAGVNPLDAKTREVARVEEQRQADDPGIDVDQLALEQDFGGDDILRLVFTTCHPALSAQARAALTLRMLGGLTTEEVARAFLTSEATIAQRIVRAKRKIGATGIPLRIPEGAERAQRLDIVDHSARQVFLLRGVDRSGANTFHPRPVAADAAS